MSTQQIPGSQIPPDAWNAIAEGYDEHITDINIRLGSDALRRVDVGPGTRMLDVAAGCGALSLPAARAGAEVLATDFAPAMVERLAARATQEGLANLATRVMDGHDLDLDDDTFDLAGSQFGVMLFDDLPRGLAEQVRVTRPGGQVLLVAFGSPAKAEFIGFFVGAVRAVVPSFPGLPMDPPPLPFQVAEPDVLRRRLTEAGLRDVRVEPTSHRMAFESGRHLYETVSTSNPIGAGMVADLTDGQRAEVQRVLDGMLRERAHARGPAVLTADVNIGIGTV